MTTFIRALELITYIILAFGCFGLKPRITLLSVSTSIILLTGWSIYALSAATPFPVTFVHIAVICVLIKEKFYISLCTAIVSSLAMNIISCFISFIIYVFFQPQSSGTSNIIYISSIIASLILIAASFTAHIRFHSLTSIVRELSLWQCIAITCLCLFDFFLSSITSVLMEQDLNRPDRYLIITTIYLTVITSLVILALYLRLHRLNKLLNEANNTNMKLLKLEENHYMTLQNKNMDLRAFRHDYNHHIRALQKLVSDSPDKLVHYIENMAEIKEYTHYISCNSLVADSVVNYYYEKFRNIKAAFQVTGMLPEHIAIEDSDLCVILSNMLSNAYDEMIRIAYDKTNTPVVYCSIFILNNYIEICVENTSHEYTGTSITGTSKADTINHGFGLRNIEKAAKKYNGSLHVDYSDNRFRTSVRLQYRPSATQQTYGR